MLDYAYKKGDRIRMLYPPQIRGQLATVNRYYRGAMYGTISVVLDSDITGDLTVATAPTWICDVKELEPYEISFPENS